MFYRYLPFHRVSSPFFHQPPWPFWRIRQIAKAGPLQTVEFVIALKQRNLERLDELFSEAQNPQHENYQNFLSLEEINDIVAPPAEVREKLSAWLLESDSSAKIEDRGDSMLVKTSVKAAEELFAVEFSIFRHRASGSKIVRTLEPLRIEESSAVHEEIQFIEGLTEFPIGSMRSQRKQFRSSFTTGGPSTDLIVPQFVHSFYGIEDVLTTGMGQSSQGVIQWDSQGYTEGDIRAYMKNLSFPYRPLQAAHVLGKPASTDGDESQMDIELISGNNPNGENWFILNNEAWVYVFANSFFNMPTVPLVISISYGLEEDSTCSNLPVCNGTAAYYYSRCNVEFQKIGLRGVSVFVASGDSGANGRSNGDCSMPVLSPSFPASSPFVTAVGATQINNAVYNLQNPPAICPQFTCISGGEEVAVSYNYSAYASGGGFSNYSTVPSWQSSVVKSYLSSGISLPPSSYYNSKGRAIPDVAAFGISGFEVINGAMDNQGDGTSMSSPTFASTITILNSQMIKLTGKPLGFVNPLFYEMFSSNPLTFNDITVGNNVCTEQGCQAGCQGFYCTKGWDPVSGLGSPNYANMLKYIQKLVEEREKKFPKK